MIKNPINSFILYVFRLVLEKEAILFGSRWTSFAFDLWQKYTDLYNYWTNCAINFAFYYSSSMSSQTTYNSWEIDTTLGMFRKHQKLLKKCRELSMLATLKTQVFDSLLVKNCDCGKLCEKQNMSLLSFSPPPHLPRLSHFSLFIQSTIALDLGK